MNRHRIDFVFPNQSLPSIDYPDFVCVRFGQIVVEKVNDGKPLDWGSFFENLAQIHQHLLKPIYIKNKEKEDVSAAGNISTRCPTEKLDPLLS